MSKEQLSPRYTRFEITDGDIDVRQKIAAGALALVTLFGGFKAVEHKFEYNQMTSLKGLSLDENILRADAEARFRPKPDGSDQNYGDAMDKFIVSKETIIESDDIRKHLVGGNEYWYSIPQKDMLQVDGYEISEARNENCIKFASDDATKANCTRVFVSDQTTDVETSE